MGGPGQRGLSERGQHWASLARAHPCRILEEWAQAQSSDTHRASPPVPRRRYLRRWHLETLLCQLQGSQQARRLVATWQHWVDAQGAEELAQSLVSGQAPASLRFPISLHSQPQPLDGSLSKYGLWIYSV